MKAKTTIFLVTLICVLALGYIAVDANQEAEAWKRESKEYEQLAYEYEQLYLKCKNQK